MNIGINCGHTKTGAGSGAVGTINESIETRNVGYKVIDRLKKRGANVVDCTIDKASSQTEYLARTVSLANKQPLDLFISIHFNAGKGKGVEVFTYGGKRLDEADKVCKNLNSLGFVNRGIKDGSKLHVVRNTKAKSMLIEVCFVDSSDSDLYLKLGADKLADAIADAIIKNTSTRESISNTVNKNYAILYNNDADKVGAEIVSWSIPNSKVVKLSEYKGGYWGVVAIGGSTETELKYKHPKINFTTIKGSDRFETVKNCLRYINKI